MTNGYINIRSQTKCCDICTHCFSRSFRRTAIVSERAREFQLCDEFFSLLAVNTLLSIHSIPCAVSCSFLPS